MIRENGWPGERNQEQGPNFQIIMLNFCEN